VPEHSALVQLQKVSRRRAGREVVRDLDLRLDRGQVLGLLGVNGAGKSTTLAMLAGALRPSGGRILLEGEDFAEHPHLARRRVGWLPERTRLWPELTVSEHVLAHARLRDLRGAACLRACTAALARTELTPLRRRLARVLSQGQRQRLGLACALVHEPPLLVLDEPGNGMDPVQAAALRATIRAHADAGGAVVLSTHLLPEVTAVCDRAAILHAGRLRHDAPLQDVSHTLELTLAAASDARTLEALDPVASVHAHDACHFRIALAAREDATALLRALLAHDLAPVALSRGRNALEDIFMTIATRPAEAA
jgi:ABC-2 type transport system ATP-binding protein